MPESKDTVLLDCAFKIALAGEALAFLAFKKQVCCPDVQELEVKDFRFFAIDKRKYVRARKARVRRAQETDARDSPQGMQDAVKLRERLARKRHLVAKARKEFKAGPRPSAQLTNCPLATSCGLDQAFLKKKYVSCHEKVQA